MSGSIMVDTDIVIDFLRGDSQAVSHLKSVAEYLSFSAITVAEVYSGIKGKKEEMEVERLFAIFTVVAVTTEIARQAGSFVNRYRPSHSVEIPDALIAATCVVSGLQLHTQNIKHYPMLAGLKPPYRRHNKGNTPDSSSR